MDLTRSKTLNSNDLTFHILDMCNKGMILKDEKDDVDVTLKEECPSFRENPKTKINSCISETFD